MTEQTKPQKIKAKLPCQWVEEEGFEFKPKPGPAKEQPAPSDTAFLLKSNPPSRPTQFPGS